MRLISLTVFLFFTIISLGQIHKHGNDHLDMKYELGFAPNMVYSLNEKAFGPGFHIHGLKILNENFGAGIGYEGIFFDNYHQAVTIFGEYIFHDFISLDIGPGLIFPNKENENFILVAHIEASAAFDIGKIHIGPMLGFAFGSDKHLSAGIHLGYHFH